MSDKKTTQYINKSHGRDEVKDIVEKLLKDKGKQQIQLLAWRVALRATWFLEKRKIKDKNKLDRFYFYYVRSLYSCRCVVAEKFPQKLAYASYASYAAAASVAASVASAAAYAAAASVAASVAADYVAAAVASAVAVASAASAVAYTEFLEQLNIDLNTLENENDSQKKPLWQNKKSVVEVPDLDELWQEHLFKPALNGELFTAELTMFDKAFMKAFETEEIVATESIKQITQFIKGELNKTNKKTNQARMILLGNGGAGKTSLVNALLEPNKQLKEDEVCTTRISITHKKYGKVGLDIWDFGGQVIMHGSHIVFISEKSLYVIVCNQRANEQPDEWIDMLMPKVDAQDNNTILVIYSHCDNSANTAWRRENAISRKYPQFEFKFFDIDFKGVPNEIDKFNDLCKIIEDSVIDQGQKSVAKEVLEIKKIIEGVKGKHYITYSELNSELAKKQKNITNADLKVVSNYGYCFPENPDFDGDIQGDFKFIKQRHWLTYGIYKLLNNEKVLTNKGILTDDIIKEALTIGKDIHIAKDGKPYDKKAEAGEFPEIISYQEKDILLFKDILVNYKFAIKQHHQRHSEILLPLATPLDEPTYYDDFQKNKDKYRKYLEIRFKNIPKDLFFKLITYIDSHLNTKLLWRTGVIVDYFPKNTDNKKPQALLEIENNTLCITTVNDDKSMFLQLLSHYVRMMLEEYSKTLVYTSLERVKISYNHYELVDSKLLDLIFNDKDNFFAKIKQHNKKTGSVTNNFNISGNNHNIQIGNDNVMNNCLEQLDDYADKYPDIAELITLIEQSKDKPDDKSILTKVSEKINECLIIHTGVIEITNILTRLLSQFK